MTAKRIEVHLSKEEVSVDQVIEAFGRKFFFRSIISTDIMSKDVVAVYLPKEEDKEVD
jgi:hypothetical protein